MKIFALNASQSTKSLTKYQNFFTTQLTSSVFGGAQLILEEYIDGRWQRVAGSQIITGDTPEFVTKVNGAKLRYRLSDPDNITQVTVQCKQVTSDDGLVYQISEGGGEGVPGPQGPQGPAGQDGADSTVPGPSGAPGADGADNATLNSVTTNGSTTRNAVQVGNLATLHPSNPDNDNAATGAATASVGGTGNKAIGNRSGTFGGRDNTVIGVDSACFGGFTQTVNGNESEGFGGTKVNLNTKYTNTIGGADHVIGLAASTSNSLTYFL